MKVEKLASPWDGRPLQPGVRGWHLLRYLHEGRPLLFTAYWNPDKHRWQDLAARGDAIITAHGMAALEVLYRGPLNDSRWDAAQVLPAEAIARAGLAEPPPPKAATSVPLAEYTRQVLSVDSWAKRALLAEEGLKAAAKWSADLPEDQQKVLNKAVTEAQQALMASWAPSTP